MVRILKFIGLGVLGLVILGFGALIFWSSGQNAERAEIESLTQEQDAPGRFVEVNGRKMHVLIKGDLNADQIPIVLLHGFSIGAYHTWFPWADSLTSERTIIVPDMLNFGHSERVPEPHADLTHQGQAALLAGLLDALGVEKVDVVGRSYGGAVSTQLILDHPGYVRKIIYVGAHIYWDDDFLIQKELSRLPFGIGEALTWGSIAGGPNGFTARDCKEKSELYCERLKILRIKGTVEGLHALNALEQVSRTPRDIAQVDIPSLVIWGGADPIVPLEDGKRLAEALGTDIHIVPGAGHWPYEKDPEQTTKWILDFFAED